MEMWDFATFLKKNSITLRTIQVISLEALLTLMSVLTSVTTHRV